MIAIFDNPVTMRREVWQDKKIMASISIQFLLDSRHPDFPRKYWPIYMPDDKFQANRIIGNEEAILK